MSSKCFFFLFWFEGENKIMTSRLVSFLQNPNRKFTISLEYTILALVIFYFVILFFSEYKTIGLEKPIMEIPENLKTANDMILGLMLGLLSFELILKYMKIRNWRRFLKKYWLDIAMVILIPVFSGIKIIKALKLTKKLKIAKYGFKAADKTQKKIRKNN